ncbi:putative polyketide synthase [Rosellinia necatrix]|uniref:Putative polyketide synthase n=1 Tax=Rosellinia necatrix TaxID=77044 RepID=A0A1S8A8F5_ROSNE|nr:putative polyketide synthase [Rosellinia necatrix]
MALHHIEKTDIAKDDICVSLLEMEREFLATISPQDTDNLKAMTDVVTDILWVTGANMLGTSPDPNLTLASGLSRALMLEQPALRYSIFDVGPAELLGANVLAACEHALKILVAAGEKDDTEFILSNGILHVSRFGPDVGINALFRRRAEPGSPVEKQPLANSYPSRVAVGRVGAPDTIHFQQLSERAGTPPAGHVDIRVVAASLGARDASALLGRADSRDGTTASELSGVVAAVGAGVLHVKAGDRVVAHAPHQLGTSVRLLAGSVQVLADHEEFNVVPTLLSSYSTALYALNHRAHLTAGESILVHEGADAVGIAAITLAQRLGATVYATADSQPKREYLVQKLGVPASHIFSSTDPSVSQAVAKQTGGRGVDVILNSLPAGALLPQQDTWRCLAEFGRFVEVGRREVDDAGRLDMRAFLRNATFTAFDLADLYYAREPSNRAVWDRLLVETLDLYRAGAIRSAPAKVFDVAAVAQAYQHFAGGKELESKVVISFENPQARIPVMPAPYLTLFNPEKVYLLIGCLGGLGRSLSRWMMARGARRFVFLGRSGTDKPSARQLVSRLEKAGGIVGVVRGDVSKAADVTAAVKACIDMQRPIGGVIQAAMGLHEALFTRMSNEAWHTGIDPKWQGTWNLHNSLDGHDNELDFFLLTSSVSGTVGTATESNYCAANGFLDTFARWRRSQGKPAVSIGLGMISEVGYLHENPEIEALLLRKGIQPLNEEEMLQIVDLALSTEAVHDPKEAHLLTGLEPANIRALGAQGYDVSTHGVLVEARASILLGSLQAEKELRESGSGGSSAQDTSVAAAPWFKDVPAPLTASFAPVADAETMKAAILTLIKKRFSNLILMPFDQIDDGKPLPGFGVDSMIASEFRTWYWTVFRVDVPFLDLMSAQKSLSILAEYVEAKIAGR